MNSSVFKDIRVDVKLQEKHAEDHKSCATRVEIPKKSNLNRATKQPEISPSDFIVLDYSAKAFSHYIRNLNGFGKDIFNFFFNRRGLADIYIKNETIAAALNCDVRTVRRWTTRFHCEGILIKRQSQGNKYDVNHFFLHPRISRGDISWHLLQENLIPEQKKVQYSTGLIISKNDVLQNKYFFSLPGINKKEDIQEIMLVSRSVRKRESARPGDGYLELNVFYNPNTEKDLENPWDYPLEDWMFQERWKSRAPRSRSIREALVLIEKYTVELRMSYQRDMDRVDTNRLHIINNQDRSDIKNYVNSPMIQDLLFSPLMNLVAREFELDEFTKMKLLVFDDVSLQDLKDILVDKARKSVYSIHSRSGFFIKGMNEYFESRNIRPDWEFTKAMWNILGIKQPIADKSRGVCSNEQITDMKKKSYSRPNFTNSYVSKKITDTPFVLDRSKVSEYSSLFILKKPEPDAIAVQIYKQELERNSVMNKLQTLPFETMFMGELTRKTFQNDIIRIDSLLEELRIKLVNT